MSYLICNLPPVQCYVKKEYLYDFQSGFGEYEPCYWVSVKSVMGRALYIESYLTNYGACYDKLPISAYVWDTDSDTDEHLPLDHLQIWDCFSYHITVLKKSLLAGLDCSVFMKNKETYKGYYLFTIDSCHSDPNELNTTLTETSNEHKSYNIIKLDNGQFCAQPNNRCLFYDQSLTANGVKTPDFRVATHEFYCEDSNKWSAGDTDDYFYELNERK